MVKKRFTVLLPLCFAIIGYGQISQTDLLKKSDSLSLHDTVRLNALKKLASEVYLYYKPDSAFYFAGLQFNLAKEKNNLAHMANSLKTQGISHYLRGNYNIAINLYLQAIKLYEQIGDKKGRAAIYNNLGNVYSDQGYFSRALQYFEKSLKIKHEINDRKGVAYSLNNMGIIYENQGNFVRAIECYDGSLRISEAINDKKGVANTLSSLGGIYSNQGHNKRALEKYEQSLELFLENGNRQGEIKALNNIGTVYFRLKDHLKAVEFFAKSLEAAKEAGNKQDEANALLNIGCVFYEKAGIAAGEGNKKSAENNYQLALANFSPALLAFQEIGDQKGECAVLNNMGIVYNALGNNQRAMEYSGKALKIALEIASAIEIKNAAYALYVSQSASGKYREALKNHEIFVSYSDSIHSEENQKEVIRQQTKYEFEKQKVIDDAHHEKQLAIAVEQKQRQKAMTLSIVLVLALVTVFLGFMFNRLKLTRKQKNIIETQKALVEEKKHLLEEKHKEITDSIRYAKRIQNAIMPSIDAFQRSFEKSFVLYEPKDVVAGDFYWLEKKDDKIFFAVGDCTGHGVPGAMVSVVCSNALSKALMEENVTDPGKLLDRTRELVIEKLAKSGEEVNDGMDVSLCVMKNLNSEREKELLWAGANNPLWIIKSKHEKVSEIKADKQPVGKYEASKPFTTHRIKLEADDTVYILTDGFQDQFGGKNNKKFKAARLKELLLSTRDQSMTSQLEIIKRTFKEWKGDSEQVDDVCIIGIRI